MHGIHVRCPLLLISTGRGGESNALLKPDRPPAPLPAHRSSSFARACWNLAAAAPLPGILTDACTLEPRSQNPSSSPSCLLSKPRVPPSVPISPPNKYPPCPRCASAEIPPAAFRVSWNPCRGHLEALHPAADNPPADRYWTAHTFGTLPTVNCALSRPRISRVGLILDLEKKREVPPTQQLTFSAWYLEIHPTHRQLTS